jgi:tRNA pseudouridine55 synthase
VVRRALCFGNRQPPAASRGPTTYHLPPTTYHLLPDMDGVLVIDKPEGLTSHDVVAVARRALRESRIGHTGTLDPLATGVLPLAIGRATRLVRFLTASDKDYVATIRFGATTDSYDADGEPTSRSDRHPDAAELEAAVAALRGRYEQLPPAFSAKKVGGQRAYDLARRKQEVSLTPVPVHVPRAEVEAFDGWSARITLTCSAGFYVRSFAHAIGQAVGTGAYLEALQRTRSGEFRLDEAMSIDDLYGDPDSPGAREGSREAVLDWLIPIDRLLTDYPAVRVTEEGRAWVGHGRELGAAQFHPDGSISRPGLHGPAVTTGREDPAVAWVRILDSGGHLIALGTPGQSPDSLHPSVVLNYN